MSGCCIGTYNLCIQQYATYQLLASWWQPSCCGAVGSQPAPIDLTGYFANMQIKPYAQSTTVLYDASSDIVLGGTAGTVALTIPAGATGSFTWWAGVYDLVLTSPAGIVTRLLSGNISVCAGVSQSSIGPQYVLLPSGQAALLPSGQGVLTP